MKQIRKVYFQNEAGERYDLNGENGVYASGLSGLGLTLAPDHADLSKGFFRPVNEEEPHASIPFTVTFTKDPYAAYQELVDWLFSAGTLTLVYDPTGAQEYYRDIAVTSLQKGEINQLGWLEIPGSYACHTPWYLPTPAFLTLDEASGGTIKAYPVSYAEDLRYGSESFSSFSGTVFGAGHIPGSIELTYFGAIVNPKIRLVGENSGKTYGICSVSVSLSESDCLKVSTRYEHAYVARISAAGDQTDLLDSLDLSSGPFFHVPVDEPSTLYIEADNVLTGRAELQVYFYYRSV